MWGWDVDSIIQVLVILAIVGSGIYRMIKGALGKPIADAEAERRRRKPSEDPARQIRDFLAEIRGEKPAPHEDGRRERPAAEQEAHAGQPRESPRPGGPAIDGQVIVWESVEDERQPPQPQRPESKPPPRPEQRRSLAAELDTSSSLPLSQVTGPEAAEPAMMAEHARDSIGTLSRRTEHLGLKRKFESRIEKRLAARAVKVGPTMAMGPALPFGLTLQEAIAAQAILGPPRAKVKWSRQVRDRRR